MKKILLLLLFLLPFSYLSAQTYKYNTTSLSIKYCENGYWSEWSDWEEARMLVVLSFDRKVISIYSDEIQEYDIYEFNGESRDDEGGKTTTLSCVNADGLRCQVRLRKQRDGQIQLYVDFKDLMWVYNLKER